MSALSWTAKIGFYLPAVSNVGENRETERVPLFASFGTEQIDMRGRDSNTRVGLGFFAAM